MMTKSYRIATIADLLTVPVEKRERCVREILTALAVSEMAYGNAIHDVPAITWTDDDSRDCEVITNGQHALTLSVQQEPKP